MTETLADPYDCVFGLTSSIHTTSLDTMMRGINKIRFGETYVNREP